MDTTTQPNIPTKLNNPGDLKEAGQANSTPSSSGFATFPTPQQGFGALLNDVQAKITKSPNETLADFANTYAPPSDGNDTAQYTASLANQLKVPPNATIGSLEPNIGQFADAIAKNEGYDPSQSQTTPQTTTSAPSFMDYLLGGTAAIGGYIASNIKPLATTGLETGGAILGGAVTDNPLGAVVGEQAGAGLANSLGLNNSTSSSNSSSTGSTDTSQTTQTDPTQEINQEDQEDIQRIQQSEQATAALSDSLQTTPTGKLLASMPSTQDALSYMAQNGYVPDTSSGVNNFSQAFAANSASRADLSKNIASVLDLEGGQGSLDDVKANAYANIEKYGDVREQTMQKALVDKELANYKEHYGDQVSLGNMERSKREQGSAAGDWQKDRPTKSGHKALYGAFRDTITKNTKHKELYEKVMKEETKSFQADKIMKKMNGKKALEHKGILRGVLKSYGKYVGTYIGDKIGGPLGAIAGTMVGDYISGKVDKKLGKTFFESKEGKKLFEVLGKKSPKAKKLLEDEIIKYEHEAVKNEKEKANRKLLPAGAIPLGGPTQTTVKAPNAKAISIQNPKTGRFAKAYTSEASAKQPILPLGKANNKRTKKKV